MYLKSIIKFLKNVLWTIGPKAIMLDPAIFFNLLKSTSAVKSTVPGLYSGLTCLCPLKACIDIALIIKKNYGIITTQYFNLTLKLSIIGISAP